MGTGPVFNRKVGKAFEQAVLESLRIPENKLRFKSKARGLKTGGKVNARPSEFLTSRIKQ